ncbi:hypothetical protein ES705_39390 [subsurface metagenome]|nr:MAG: TRAP transporter small permease subunit [Candidatus Atribacteria bacterium 1244-E10-H5-B2]
MQKIKAILNFIDSLNERIGKFSGLLMIPMCGVIIWEVVCRHVFNAPTLWAFETNGFIFFIYLMLGGGYSYLHKAHVNIDLIYSRFSTRQKAVIDVCTSILFFVFCFVLLFKGSKWAWKAFLIKQHSGSYWNPPMYHVMAFLPIGAILMILQGISKFIRDLNIVITGKEL